MMKRYVIFVCLLLMSLSAFGQIKYYNTAVKLYNENDYAEAVEQLDVYFSKWRRDQDKESKALYLRGVCYLKLAFYDKAITDFTKALDEKSDSKMKSRLYEQRGKAYEKIGDRSAAIADFEQAFALHPTNVVLRDELNRLRNAQQNTNAALAIRWLAPSQETETSHVQTYNLQWCIEADNDITTSILYLNDVAQPNIKFSFGKKSKCDYEALAQVELQEGENRFKLFIKTESGQVYSDEHSVRFINEVLPTITITSPQNLQKQGNTLYAQTSEKRIELSGIAESSIGVFEVLVNGQEASLDKDGFFKAQIPLAMGENKVSVVVKDVKQHSSKQELLIERGELNTTLLEQKRVALVVGNSEYQYERVSVLKNPTNDANDMAHTLEGLGFEVTKLLDADYATLDKSIKGMLASIQDADVALFYYAGHGIEVDGTNYLVPVDAKLEKKEQVIAECVAVDYMSKYMGMNNDEHLNIIILDACRNNPFKSWSRSGGGGLSRVVAPQGTIIAYSTEPGATASDGTGNNGLYTEELIKQLKVPQRITDVFMNTRKAVSERTNENQVPWSEASLNDAFYLKK